MATEGITTTGNAGAIASGSEIPVEEVIQPKAKKELVDLPWTKTGMHHKFYRARAIKLMKPVCHECQGTTSPRGWWEMCTHNPYYDTQPVEVAVPILECSACHEEVPEGTIGHCKGADLIIIRTDTHIKQQVVPRTVEVRMDVSINSGNTMAKAQQRGCVFPQELGFSPMCEYTRCYSPNPTIATNYGHYCSVEHAAIVRQSEQGEAMELVHEGKRAAQLSTL